MPEREDRHSDDREDGFITALVKRERTRHHSKAQRPDCRRKDEPVLQRAAAKRDCAQDHRQAEADLVKDGLPEKTANRRKEAEKYSRREAMDETEPRQPNGETVKPSGMVK